MAQNQEHRFVPALVDRVGYPVWSAAVLSDLPEKPDGKLLLIPFVKFDESEVQAVLSAIFTSEEEDPYILLGEKSALLSLIPYVPEEQLGHTKLSVLATLLLDDELFSHTDETLLAWIKGQLAESDDDDFMDDLDFRCLGVVVIDICGPINTTIQVLKEDEIEVRFDCVSYTVDLGCGGGGGSWWGSTPSSGNGGSNPDGGIFTGGGTPSGPLSNAGSISLSGFNGISNLHELLQTCAVSGEGHEPGHNAELGGVCDGLNQIIDVFGLEDIGWLLNSRRDLFDQLSAWLKLNDDALSHQAAWSYVRYVQSGGTLPFREFAGPFISITSWAAEVGITLDDDQFGWLLENMDVAVEFFAFSAAYPNDEMATAYVEFVFQGIEVWGNVGLDVLNPFEEYANNLAILESETVSTQAETQNGIEIFTSYLPGDPQNPIGAPFGGSEANPNGGPDLLFGTTGDISILDPTNQVNAGLPPDIQEYRLEWLFFMATFFDASGKRVADDYLAQFHENEAVFDHFNSTLSEMVMNSTQMKNWLKDYGDELNQRLIVTGGDIDGVVNPIIIDRLALNESYSLTILINDTQVTNVYRLDSYNYDDQTGEWDCHFLVNVRDHFGLDDGDVVDFQNHYPGGNGFVAWWTLQHIHGWAPFVTDIWFVVHLGGKI